MILAIVLVICAFLALCVIFSLTVTPGLVVSRRAKGQIEPIDIEAFRNLADPGEYAYLRHRLTDSEFRKVQRTRLRAMLAYIQVAGRNALVLIQIAQIAVASNDPNTAEAAQRLLDDAILLRRNTLVAHVRIYAALAWPTSNSSASPILIGYERLNGSAMLLGRLQNPTVPVRISAAS